MMLRRPAGGKAAVELAREASLCEAAVPLSCSFVPKHAVPRALDKAFRALCSGGSALPAGLEPGSSIAARHPWAQTSYTLTGLMAE
jgi:hypothetical protein